MNAVVLTPSVDDGVYYGPYNVSTSMGATNLRQKKSVIKVLPRNAVQSTCFQTSGAFDINFDLTQLNLDYIENLYLKMNLANGDAVNAMNLVDLTNFFDYITVYCNNEEVQTLYGPAMRNNLILSNDSSALNSMLSPMGMATADYTSNLTIGTSSNVDVYLPVLDTILSVAEVPMWRDNLQWRITFRTRGGAALIRSGAAVATSLTVTSGTVELWATGILLSEGIKRRHESNLVLGGAKIFRYLDQTRSQISAGAVVSGTTQTLNYQDSGHMSHAYLVLQTSAPVGTQLYNSAGISTIDFLDNNIPVLQSVGDNQYTTAFASLTGKELWTNTAPLTAGPIYYISPSANPVLAIKKGGNMGSYKSDGSTESIRFTPTANIASGILNVYAHYYSSVIVDFAAGRMLVQRKTL